MSFELTTRKTRNGKMILTKAVDKSLKSNQPLESSKLKSKRLTTFIKKKAIGTPELHRREYLKSLLKSKSKIVTGQCIFCDKCVDSKSMLTGPKRSSCFECELPIHKKCAIANGVMLQKNLYCCYDCMRDDEMMSVGYPFKCAIRYDNKEYVCYLS